MTYTDVCINVHVILLANIVIAIMRILLNWEETLDNGSILSTCPLAACPSSVHNNELNLDGSKLRAESLIDCRSIIGHYPFLPCFATYMQCNEFVAFLSFFPSSNDLYRKEFPLFTAAQRLT